MSKTLKLMHDINSQSVEDRISQLPDEILGTILSRLTLKEAAQTSIISQRWKTIWTFANVNMEFDAPSVMLKLDTVSNQDWLIKTEGKKFAKWVNKVLVLHKGEVADCFKVCFDLDSTHKRNLDRWIQFAIQKKKVSRLEVLLREKIRGGKELYSLPEEVLSYSHVNLLKVVRLSEVEVSGPLLEGILTKCPSLEEISVSWSQTLVGVIEVCGINLKVIELHGCFNVEYLVITAPNLMSLAYLGGPSRIRITCAAPKLHGMEFGGCYSDDHFPMYPDVSSFFSQIDTLALDFGESNICELPPVFPEYKMLKFLRLKLGTDHGKSLLSCIFMLKACPKLHTLVVEFYPISWPVKREIEKIEGEELQCLKVVDLQWFYGLSADVELAICIIQNSPNLEKIIFDPWRPLSKSDQKIKSVPNVALYDKDPRRVEARKCARKLAEEYCHADIEVVVL